MICAIDIPMGSIFTYGTIVSQPPLLTSAKAVCVSTGFTILRAVERTLVTVIALFTSYIKVIYKYNFFYMQEGNNL